MGRGLRCFWYSVILSSQVLLVQCDPVFSGAFGTVWSFLLTPWGPWWHPVCGWYRLKPQSDPAAGYRYPRRPFYPKINITLVSDFILRQIVTLTSERSDPAGGYWYPRCPFYPKILVDSQAGVRYPRRLFYPKIDSHTGLRSSCWISISISNASIFILK